MIVILLIVVAIGFLLGCGIKDMWDKNNDDNHFDGSGGMFI